MNTRPRQTQRTFGRSFLAGILLVFFCAVLAGGLFSRDLHATVPVQIPGFRYTSVLEHIETTRNGTVEFKVQADLLTVRDNKVLTFTVPYAAGQSVSFEQLQIADVDANGKSQNYLGSRLRGELLDDSPIGSYSVIDNGSMLSIQLAVSAPANAKRRVLLSYKVYQSARRYPDAGDITLQIFSGHQQARIEKLGILISFESTILPGELKQFKVFQHHNLHTAEALLEDAFANKIKKNLGVPNEIAKTLATEYWGFLGLDLPPSSGLELRFLTPSVWLARTLIEQDSSGSARERILEDEKDYQRRLVQRYVYRNAANSVVVMGFVLSILLYLAFHWYSIFERYRLTRQKVTAPPEAAEPGLLAYLETGKASGRVILSTIFKLASSGFIRLEEDSILRVTESIIPSDEVLRPFERTILYWVWDLMEGEDSLRLDQLDIRFADPSRANYDVALRVRNFLDVECAARGWVPLPGEKKPHRGHLLTGFALLLLAVVLSWLGSYFVPFTLLVPALTFFITAFTNVRFTREGYQFLAACKAYERYLENIDNQKISAEMMMPILDRDFINSVALGCEKQFLMNLRYVLTVQDLLNSGFFGRYGFGKIQHILEAYIERKGNLKARYIQWLFQYLSREVNKRYIHLQTALVRLWVKLEANPPGIEGEIE